MTAMTEQQSPGQHRQMFGYCRLILFSLAGILLLNAASVSAQELVFPEKPPGENWFVDEADLIGVEERSQIDETALTLWQEEQIPVYIVTIRSIAGYNPSGEPVSIEYYAHRSGTSACSSWFLWVTGRPGSSWVPHGISSMTCRPSGS